MDAYAFSHKIWGGQKRQSKNILLQLLSRFRVPVAHTLMQFPAQAFQKIVLLKYHFSNKYYNIRISALPSGGRHLIGYGRLLKFSRFTRALIRIITVCTTDMIHMTGHEICFSSSFNSAKLMQYEDSFFKICKARRFSLLLKRLYPE